ncbi:MAG TPA: efflux RND transporter periplasmic adaptor subunit [Steroidobacter sp.]|uniref:efflux RND transporter periplasmic adaptor subunit n=1 Tax=Steroidobacter sp. TaxID=1978227 RepID=UPI002ED956FD
MRVRSAVWFGAASMLVAAIVAFASIGVDQTDDPEATGEQTVLTVQTTMPQLREWRDEVVAHGSIVAWHEATIGAELGGLRLIDVRVDVGSRVVAGDLLARFDPAPIEAELNERKAALAEAEAALTEADENAARAESLRNTGALSGQAVTQYLTRAQTARAQVDSARARVESTRLRLRQTRVLAPDAGVISARSATLGSVAGAGDELFRLVRQNRLEWQAQVAAADLPRIQPGQMAKAMLPDGSIIEGTVRQVAPLLTQNLTAIAYVALSPDVKPAPRAGMFVSGAILTGASSGLSLPSSSIVVRDGREYAFVLDRDSVATQVQLRTGRRIGEQVEVLDGVTSAQSVVLSGGGFLHDGDRVRVVTAAEQQAATR